MNMIDDKFRQRGVELLQSPQFRAARQSLCDGYLGLFENNAALNKLLVEISRLAIVLFTVCLHARQRDDDPATWLTLGRLQDEVATLQLASPGRVEAIVARMIDMGLMTQRPAPGDARKRILVPSPVMLAHDLDMITAQARAGLILNDCEALRHGAERNPAFHRAYNLACLDGFVESVSMISAHGEMVRIFLSRDCGYMVLLCLEQSAQSSEDGLVSTVAFQAIADRFGVSRSHVHNIVDEAIAAGLMRAGARRSEFELLPQLFALNDRLIADSFAIQERRFTTAHASLAHAH